MITVTRARVVVSVSRVIVSVSRVVASASRVVASASRRTSGDPMKRHLCVLVVLSVAAAALAAQAATSERLLFDGKSTQGWRGFKKSTFPDRGWVVENGWLKHLATSGQD